MDYGRYRKRQYSKIHLKLDPSRKLETLASIYTEFVNSGSIFLVAVTLLVLLLQNCLEAVILLLVIPKDLRRLRDTYY